MKKVGETREHVFFLWWLLTTLHFLSGCSESTSLLSTEARSSLPGVKLIKQKQQLVVDNSVVRVSLSKDGFVVGISYNGIDNVLPAHHDYIDRGYWDLVWNEPGGISNFERITGIKFSVVSENDDQVELSFFKEWTLSVTGSSVPMNIDKRYIFRKGDSGFYMYGIFERTEGMPAVEVDQIRVVFKLREDRFHYMAISDSRQRIMPSTKDRSTGHCQPLAYPEAVLLTSPSNPALKGEVDDKYQYSCENKDNTVHGWISDSPAPVGFWMITPSNEFRNGGPIKQDLTSHVGPIALNMFVSTHYAGKEVTMAFQQGETYKKVFGPVFVYLNSALPNSQDSVSKELWTDAKNQMSKEVQRWPYDFPQTRDYFPPNERGTISGQLLVQDRYIKRIRYQYADSAYVGLALPGEAGSWQRESKGYQFWTQADNKGYFTIKNVVPGDYNLYAWVPGIIGDYRYNATITITPGGFIKLGSLTYIPPRNGPTIWEIGIPDRSAAEFYVPDPYPTLINRLYRANSKERFRQYGLWERYADLYKKNDLVYNVGVSDYSKDWFFEHVPRKIGYNTYNPTTWQIAFHFPKVARSGNYTLRIALASAVDSELQVRVNDPKSIQPEFTTGEIGGDSAIARHGVHGLHWLFNIDVPSDRFFKGKNSIYLTPTKARTPFLGVMYDYIRLEKPPSPRTL
ncbi:hypothetical protein L6164_027354 [Bauhinia variegata]|uniref:Uncharacterized protein n=1 Tax=Bauhinia variegata TaxID=167791 RepID=A0ACB9LSX0_BAUVA|nr:hypothetical protein L6164_027354 [Bauhinia variegata]